MRVYSAPGKLAPQPVLIFLVFCLTLAALAASASGAVAIPWGSFPHLLWGELAPDDMLMHNVLLAYCWPALPSILSPVALLAF